MFKVTAEAFHEKVFTDSEEVVLNGPPSALRGHISLRNTSADLLSVKALSLINDASKSSFLGNRSQLRIGTRLAPGQEKLEKISHELPAQTPPGTYESTLVIGGMERRVKMIVQPNMQINVFPLHFSFIGTEPQKKHTAQITITNLGNLPFQVPDVKHVAALDMDLICRAFGFALRSKGAEGYTSTMDEIARNVNRYLPDWAGAHIDECGQTLQPGATIVAHLTITMPNNTDAAKDYAGNMRFWNEEITYEIKSQTESLNTQ